jgi:hypothetical protein
VLIVRVLENVGLLEAGLKPQDAPKGRPLVQDKVTDCVEPDCRVAVIVFELELP